MGGDGLVRFGRDVVIAEFNGSYLIIAITSRNERVFEYTHSVFIGALDVIDFKIGRELNLRRFHQIQVTLALYLNQHGSRIVSAKRVPA